MRDHLDEQTVIGMAGLNYAALGKRSIARVEVEPRLPLLLVGTVAGKAVVGENREDVTGKADGHRGGLVRRAHARGGRGHEDSETRGRQNRRANVAEHMQATSCHRMGCAGSSPCLPATYPVLGL